MKQLQYFQIYIFDNKMRSAHISYFKYLNTRKTPQIQAY